MLLFVRGDVLAQSDFGMCLRRLQRFPPVEDIGVLVERAKAIQPVVATPMPSFSGIIAGTRRKTRRWERGLGWTPIEMSSGGGGGGGGWGDKARLSSRSFSPLPTATCPARRWDPPGPNRAGCQQAESRRVLVQGKDAIAVGRQKAEDFLAKALGRLRRSWDRCCSTTTAASRGRRTLWKQSNTNNTNNTTSFHRIRVKPGVNLRLRRRRRRGRGNRGITTHSCHPRHRRQLCRPPGAMMGAPGGGGGGSSGGAQRRWM